MRLSAMRKNRRDWVSLSSGNGTTSQNFLSHCKTGTYVPRLSISNIALKYYKSWEIAEKSPESGQSDTSRRRLYYIELKCCCTNTLSIWRRKYRKSAKGGEGAVHRPLSYSNCVRMTLYTSRYIFMAVFTGIHLVLLGY